MPLPPSIRTLNDAIAALNSKAQDDINIYLAGQNINYFNGLATALQQTQTVKRITLNVSNCKLSESPIKAFCQALASGTCTPNLSLNLSDNNLYVRFGFVLNALKSGHAPRKLTLILNNNYLQDAGLSSFFDTLASGNCPPSLTVSFQFNFISQRGLARLPYVVAQGCLPDRLSLNFAENKINDEGASLIAQTIIESAKEIKALSINLHRNMITVDGILEIISALNQQKEQLGYIRINFGTVFQGYTVEQMRHLMRAPLELMQAYPKIEIYFQETLPVWTDFNIQRTIKKGTQENNTPHNRAVTFFPPAAPLVQPSLSTSPAKKQTIVDTIFQKFGFNSCQV